VLCFGLEKVNLSCIRKRRDQLTVFESDWFDFNLLLTGARTAPVTSVSSAPMLRAFFAKPVPPPAAGPAGREKSAAFTSPLATKRHPEKLAEDTPNAAAHPSPAASPADSPCATVALVTTDPVVENCAGSAKRCPEELPEGGAETDAAASPAASSADYPRAPAAADTSSAPCGANFAYGEDGAVRATSNTGGAAQAPARLSSPVARSSAAVGDQARHSTLSAPAGGGAAVSDEQLARDINEIYLVQNGRQDFVEFAASCQCRLPDQLMHFKGQCTDEILALLIQGSGLTCSALADKILRTLAGAKQSNDSVQVAASAQEISDRIPGIADRVQYGVGSSEADALYVWEVKNRKLLERLSFAKQVRMFITSSRASRKAARSQLKLLTKMRKNLATPNWLGNPKNLAAFQKHCEKRLQLATSDARPQGPTGSAAAEDADVAAALQTEADGKQQLQEQEQQQQQQQQQLAAERAAKQNAERQQAREHDRLKKQQAAAEEKATKARQREALKERQKVERQEAKENLRLKREKEKLQRQEERARAKELAAQNKELERHNAKTRKAEAAAQAEEGVRRKAKKKKDMWAAFGFAQKSKSATQAAPATAAASPKPSSKIIYKKYDAGYSWKLTSLPAVTNQCNQEFHAAVRDQLGDQGIVEIVQAMRAREQQQRRSQPATARCDRLPRKFLDFRGYDTLKNRPPYFGRMDRRSSIVTGRRPFAKEKEEVVDYDWDSEEDWEPDGEDIVNSDGEDDGEEGVEEGDGFVVPDGTYSDDEGIEAGGDRLVGISTTSTAKAIVILQSADLTSASAYISLHAVITGPESFSPFDCDVNGKNVLDKAREEQKRKVKEEEQRRKDQERQRKMLRDDMLPYLVQIVHTTVKGKDQIVKEFLNKHPAVSKKQVFSKLNEVALKEKRIDVEGVLSGIESYHLYLIRSLPQAL
jgi:hypothetical protein